MDSLGGELVSVASSARVAGHLDRLLLGVSCGKTKSAAKSNSLPSTKDPVTWTQCAGPQGQNGKVQTGTGG